MILRCASWSILLCLVLHSTVNAEVHVTEKGYQNVVISFSPNVPSENGQELIKNITQLLEETSSALYTAIGKRIATATFRLPASWATDTWEEFKINPATIEEADSKPDINVDATLESAFGKQPVALQYGGCGVPGHQIILPLEFLSSTPSYPKDKLLAREWLKYRYGVFEENGFQYDAFYPEYYRIPGRSDITVTHCTNTYAKYTFKKPLTGTKCTIMDASEFHYCRPHPDEETVVNTTSSLMYFHQELQNMEHVCGKDHPHQNTTLSKQNILCSGRSIWDVVESSNDFKMIQQEPNEEVSEPIQFSYIQSSQPRFIVLLEDSENLFEKKSSIQLAIKRFYYDLPPKSKLAIYTFTNDATNIEETLPYRELLAERSDLGNIADFITTTEKICSSCGLLKATETFLQNNESRKGSILLITASSLDAVPELPGDLKATGISLNVVRFADGEEPVPVDTPYEALRDSFSSFSYIQISHSSEELNSFKTLYSFLKETVPESNDFNSKIVVSEMMSADKTVTIPEDATASFYTLWVGSALTSSASIKCRAGDADVTLTAGVKGANIASFTFSPLENEVTCRLSSPRLPPVLTQVQMTTQKGYYFNFDTWIHDASTDSEQKPIIIYAKIYFGGHPVKEATVIAAIIAENKQEEDIANTSNNAEEIIVKMVDNGRGDPDITRNDGVYSGYFIGFETAGNYKITLKMNDNQGKAKIGKEDKGLTTATCCGSEVFGQDDDVPAFQMEKVTEYTAKNKMPEGGYPPSRIVDLRMEELNSSDSAILTWTAPGGGKAGRYEVKLFQNRENAVKNFDTTGDSQYVSNIVPLEPGESEKFMIYFKDLVVDSTFYVTIRSWSETNKSSEISNVVEFFLPKEGDGTTGTEPSTTVKEIEDDDSAKRAQTRRRTIEIVVGVLAGIVVLCILVYLGVYFFVQKPKRKEEKARARKKAQNGAGSRPSSGPSGQIGMNSIPADVIIRHHNEVVEAKNLHKDPPIFKEENLNSSQSSPELPENARRNNNVAQYAIVQKAPEAAASNSSQQDPSKSPKRMTVV